MNFTKLLGLSFFFFCFDMNVLAQSSSIQGAELENLVVAEKGTTWELANGSRVTFFPNRTFLDCLGKPGLETCDDGTYTISDDSVERKYHNWFKKTGGVLKVVFRKEGEKFFFNKLEVLKRNQTPTLVPATKEQILALAGKDFKIQYGNESFYAHRLSANMELFSCSKEGCGRTFPLKIDAPWVEFTYISQFGITVRQIMVSENGVLLWDGKKLIGQ